MQSNRHPTWSATLKIGTPEPSLDRGGLANKTDGYSLFRKAYRSIGRSDARSDRIRNCWRSNLLVLNP